jgi:hypothetical protein
MSELTMGRRIAQRSVPSVALAVDDTKTQLERILGYLTAYIPTTVVTAFIPVWAAVVASEVPTAAGATAETVPTQVKFAIALITAVLAGGLTWAVGHVKARKLAKDNNKEKPGMGDTLMAGKVDITLSVIAAFAWASVAPRNWAGIDQDYAVIGIPAALGIVFAIIAAVREDD